MVLARLQGWSLLSESSLQLVTGLAEVGSELLCWVSQTIFVFLLFAYIYFPVVLPWCLAKSFKSAVQRASLVVQWLRICLPMQGTWVRALAREDPTCRGANKPMCHNY